MNPPTVQAQDIHWKTILIETAGFIWGFVVGVVTGMFGNWGYEKFKSFRKKPHGLNLNSTPHLVEFSGAASQGNKLQVLETLCKAITDPRGYTISIKVDPKNSAK